MPYASVEQFKNPAFGLPEKYLVKVPDLEIEGAIAQASGKADSYLRQRYRLPLSSWSEELSGPVCHIAAYHLVTGKGFTGQGSDEHLYLRYKEAIKWLEGIAAGKVTPDVQESPAPSDPADDTNAPTSGTAIVTKDKRGW